MKISRPTRPKSFVFICYRRFLRTRVRPFGRIQGGNTPFGAGEKPGRAPRGRVHPAMRSVKSTQKGTLQQGSVVLKFSTAALLHALQRCCQPFEMLERSVWFGAHGAHKFKFSHFLVCCFGSGAADPYIFASPQGCSSTGAAPGLEKCKGDMPMTNVRKNSAKLTHEDLKTAPESPTMERQELAVPCEFSVRNSMVISDRKFGPNPCRRTF